MLIPKKIFQTFETTQFPEGMSKACLSWKIKNPDWEYYFFDKNDRVEFIKKHFSECNIDETLELTGYQKFKNNITIRRSGSAALDMAYVAAGKFDGCFQKNIKIWDIAAGLILVKEAGGIINNIDINIIAQKPKISK